MKGVSMDKLKAWMQTATSGQGAVALAGTAVGYFQHALNGSQAIVGLVIGIALILFPEKPAVSTAAGAVATDLEQALAIFSSGVTHGMTGRGAVLDAIAKAGGPVVTDAAALVQVAVQGPSSAPEPTATPTGTPQASWTK